MSAGRFKSKDDYFARRSGLAERVIAAKPQQPPAKPGRRRGVENAVPAPLLRVHFCKTVERFELTGKGRFHRGDYPLDDALQSHLDGETTLLVNPLSSSGETAFTVVRFDLAENMDHPFSKARQYADELQKFGVSGLIEVTEGGKGHYHLWIFHEQPVPAVPFSEALVRLGHRLFGVILETVPPVAGEASIPLPLQGESVLLQRRVFVNAVGKMIKEQGNVLQEIEYCPKQVSDGFIARMSAMPKPAPASRPQIPPVERRPVPPVVSHPAAAPAATPPAAAKPAVTPPAAAPVFPAPGEPSAAAPAVPVPSAPAPVSAPRAAQATIPAEPPKAAPTVEKPKAAALVKPEEPELEPVFPKAEPAPSAPIAAPVPVEPAEAAAPEPVSVPVEAPSGEAASTPVEAAAVVTASASEDATEPEKNAEIEARDTPEPEKAVETDAREVPEPATVVPAVSDASSPQTADMPEIRSETPEEASPEPRTEIEPAAVEAPPAPSSLTAFVFRRNGAEYGIAVDLVETVAAAGGILPLPGAGKEVRGMLTVCGRTVTVLDLGVSSPGGAPALSRRDRVIVLKARAGGIGLLADGVSGMAVIPAERIAPFAGDGRFREAAELAEQGRTILLPDVDRLLARTDGEARRPEGRLKAELSPEPHVLFSGGGAHYALPARSVREILAEPPAERSRSLAGGEGGKTPVTVSWRGGILPVIDIRTAAPVPGGGAGTAEIRKPARGRILVMRADDVTFGVRVDAVAGIRTIPHGEVVPVTGGVAPVRAIVRLPGSEGTVRVLDPEQVGKLGMRSAG